MHRESSFKPLARAVLVMGAVMAIVSGATFAALQSQQSVLAGNTISTATADLKISSNGSAYGQSSTGFSFANLIPGGPAVPAAGNSFYLKNSGSTNVALNVSVGAGLSNTANVDLSKVSLTITRMPEASTQTFTIAELVAANTTGGLALTKSIDQNTIVNYIVRASMAADAFSGSSATLSNVDIVFGGIAVAQ